MDEIPYGFCQCGCGRTTKIAPKTIKQRNQIKGKPMKFIRGHGHIPHPGVKENPRLCECGCGQITNIAKRNKKERGWIKGAYLRFIQGHSARMSKRGAEHPLYGKPISDEHRKQLAAARAKSHSRIGKDSPKWKGGEINRGRYLVAYAPGHPRANDKYVPKHILIAEHALGKFIGSNHPIHHHPVYPSEQLVICQDAQYHQLIHKRYRAFLNCGHANWKKCTYCKKYDSQENLYKNVHRYYHRICRREYLTSRKLATHTP